jgi:hypothetical protein
MSNKNRSLRPVLRPRRPRQTRRLATLGAALLVSLLASSAWAQHGPRGGHPRHGHHIDPRTDITLEPGMPAHGVGLWAYGELSCGSIIGGSCVGYYDGSEIDLTVRRGMWVDIEVTSASFDTVLGLVGPSGRLSDDDGGVGTNSRLTTFLEAGRHELHVGSYAWGRGGELTLRIGQAATPAGYCPITGVWLGTPTVTTVAPRPVVAAPAPAAPSGAALCPVSADVIVLGDHSRGGRATGRARGWEHASADVGAGGVGFLPNRAQVCLVVEDSGHYDVEVTSSRTDTVMAIVPVSGRGRVHFDDDGGDGFLSRFSGRLRRGTYLVYVGTYTRGDRAPFQLAAR